MIAASSSSTTLQSWWQGSPDITRSCFCPLHHLCLWSVSSSVWLHWSFLCLQYPSRLSCYFSRGLAWLLCISRSLLSLSSSLAMYDSSVCIYGGEPQGNMIVKRLKWRCLTFSKCYLGHFFLLWQSPYLYCQLCEVRRYVSIANKWCCLSNGWLTQL